MIRPLTSLRFVFALMVFMSHLNFVPDEYTGFNNIFRDFLSEGYLGVSFFFVLSGFILAFNYKEKLGSGLISRRSFWVARVARIVPMHLFSLLLAIPVSLAAPGADKLYWLFKLAANALLIQSYFPVEEIHLSFNYVSWSISDEMFFYALFPFLIAALLKYNRLRRLGWLWVLMIPAAIAITPEHLHRTWFYIHPFSRLADFWLGILLFEFYRGEHLKRCFSTPARATLAEVAAILLFVLFFVFHDKIPGGYRYSSYYWLPMLAVIFVFAQSAGAFSAILSRPLPVLLGEISFSFYLLHQLSIRWLYFINERMALQIPVFLIILFMFLVALAGSYLCYRLVEMPCRSRVKKWLI